MNTLEIRLDLALLHSRPRMSQDALAKALGVNKSWISGVKKGRWNGEPKLRQAAEVLGVPADWLIHGTGPAPGWFYFNEESDVEIRAHGASGSRGSVEAGVIRSEPPPPWAAQILAELQALRAEVAELKKGPPVSPDDSHIDTAPPLPTVTRGEQRRRIQRGQAITEADRPPLSPELRARIMAEVLDAPSTRPPEDVRARSDAEVLDSFDHE